MTVYFTADTHFGHANIIKLAKRPFRSLQEMDDALVANWNALVQPEDTVYHLGDFCFTGSKVALRYLERLNGEIILIKGNHDTKNTAKLPRWQQVHEILEISVEKQRLCLCHYPMLEWPGAFRKSVHLHGHTHGAIDPNARRCDVGVDVWDYRPVTLAQILARLEKAPAYHPTDHYRDQVS
ncbi:MAG: metallophosphoesterase family protein [Neomegalonema sp.]|nr:metallophosphoesterase family protein [Neomegalonema sp.]